ncbi:MAG: hypothetical protein PHF31_14280 [Methylobacter sp.]|jgi:hypothetical protein|nr:hypothetical protein [Methylobacter sp.]
MDTASIIMVAIAGVTLLLSLMKTAYDHGKQSSVVAALKESMEEFQTNIRKVMDEKISNMSNMMGSKIEKLNDVLDLQIKELQNDVKRLDTEQCRVVKQVNGHETRLQIIEANKESKKVLHD